jgi:flagellar FliL protein
VAVSDAQGGNGGGGLMGFVIVSVIALGLGAGFGMFLAGNAPKDEAAKVAGKDNAPAVEKPVAPKGYPDAKLVEMAPIVANLGGPGDSWIRIEASILVQGFDEGANALAAQLAEDFAAYLKTATLSQFEGPSGFQNLREDFLDRATIRDREHIKDVIIHGVVVE